MGRRVAAGVGGRPSERSAPTLRRCASAAVFCFPRSRFSRCVSTPLTTALPSEEPLLCAWRAPRAELPQGRMASAQYSPSRRRAKLSIEYITPTRSTRRSLMVLIGMRNQAVVQFGDRAYLKTRPRYCCLLGQSKPNRWLSSNALHAPARNPAAGTKGLRGRTCRHAGPFPSNSAGGYFRVHPKSFPGAGQPCFVDEVECHVSGRSHDRRSRAARRSCGHKPPSQILVAESGDLDTLSR